jgi:short subunit dehydrogenase-like uncharacterized protein
MSGSDPSSQWMLYGANGYTGRLIAEEAVARGERPILAGRRADAVTELATKLDLEMRVFSLDGDVAKHLAGVSAVLHAAGPFSSTSGPMVTACLEAKAHYLDITGEIRVFEACFARGAEAAERGVVVLPGVGFDVVPSDCLAKRLAEELPGADRLELAIAFASSPSTGTARTMLEGMPEGGAVREDGHIRRIAPGSRTTTVRFRDKERSAVSIPWGDVSTAYHSTGIPNVTVYMAASPAQIFGMKVTRPLLPLLKMPAIKRFLDKQLEGRGPSNEALRTRVCQLWGRVTDPAGKSRSATLTTPEGYRLTAKTSVEAVRRVVAGDVAPGAQTPSLAFGAKFIEEFEGSVIQLD